MIIIYLQMGGGKIKGIKWLFYFSFLLKMITFAVYFYPLLHRDGTVQILQNLLVRIIYHGIVQTVAFPAHALPDAFLSEHPLILFMLVLPALVRMENEVCSVWNFCKCLVQHGCHHAEHRAIRYGIADQIAAVQIENWRQIQFLAKQTELCHIGDPLLVWLFGAEVPV